MHTYTPNEVPLSSYARFGSSWLFYKFASFLFIFFGKNTFKIKPDEQIAQIGKSTRRSAIIGLIQSILDQPSLVSGWWKINCGNGQLVVKFLCDYEIWKMSENWEICLLDSNRSCLPRIGRWPRLSRTSLSLMFHFVDTVSIYLVFATYAKSRIYINETC